MNSELREHLSNVKEICKTRLSSNKKCENGCQFYFTKEHRCCFSDTPSGWIIVNDDKTKKI